MLEQKRYKDLIEQYQDRIKKADVKHSNKFKAIRDSRMFLKQVLPEISDEKLADDGTTIPSNNQEDENRSVYCPPVSLAIKKKIIEDLTSSAYDFEYQHNDRSGKAKAETFMDIFARTFTQENIMTEHLMNLINLIDSGTCIVQPIKSSLSETVIAEFTDEEGNIDMRPQVLNSGTTLGFYSYDPLRTLIDPNADPHRVQKTAEWIAVTIGEKSGEYIKQKYDVDVKIITVEEQKGFSSKGGSKSYLVVDEYKKELEEISGLENKTGFLIREYYLTNGKKYTILEDQYVIYEGYNSSRVYGQIPIMVCPAIIDPESPYGIPLIEELRPSVEMVSTAINVVADNAIMRNRFPWVTIKGLIDPDTMNQITSGQYNSMNDIIELNPEALKYMPNLNIKSVINLFEKPAFQEVTGGSQFLYSEGMNNIWLIAGMNPVNLSGRQDKQIRVQSVADMINMSSMRNSSQLVKNLDTYYFNPLCKAFQAMYYVYYDEFPELKAAGIEKQNVADMKNIRIVNGSYLPQDQATQIAKAQLLTQRLAVNPMTYDPNKVEEKLLSTFGLKLEDFDRDPLQFLDERIIESLIADMQQLGPEQFMQKLEMQRKQAQMRENMPEGADGPA